MTIDENTLKPNSYRPKFSRRLVYVAAMVGLLTFVISAASPSRSAPKTIPAFKDTIALNSMENEDFLVFLEENEGSVVFIDAIIDLSPALLKHVEVLDACNDAYTNANGDQELLDGYILNIPIVLPVAENIDGDGRCFRRITFLIESELMRMNTSHGGTGIVMVSLAGFFRIEVRAYSGPEMRYVLIPYQADPELFNKYSQ